MTDFLATALAITGWELVKQVGVQATRRFAPPTITAGLQALDRLLPQLVAEGVTGAELEARIRAELGHLTGSDWSAIRREFDPVVFVERHQAGEGE